MNQHLAFLQSQAAHIESQVYQIQYPDIQYRGLVPVDTSAAPFAGEVTYYSMDGYGQVKFMGNDGTDFPFVETDMRKHSVQIENLGVGYSYNEWELGMAQMLGINLTADKASIVRRVSEEKLDQIIFNGQPDMGWDGLIDSALVTKSDAPAGAGGVTEWLQKTPDEIIKDVTTVLSGIVTTSLQIERADTILLPLAALHHIASTPRASGSDMSILEWIKRYNVYTAETGAALMVRSVRGLENAAAGNHGRMIAYRRDPQILRFHMPMPLRFYPAQQWLLRYIVPAVMRCGGLEIRRPGGIRYLDLITD